MKYKADNLPYFFLPVIMTIDSIVLVILIVTSLLRFFSLPSNVQATLGHTVHLHSLVLAASTHVRQIDFSEHVDSKVCKMQGKLHSEN